jgi:hypothetical protein
MIRRKSGTADRQTKASVGVVSVSLCLLSVYRSPYLPTPVPLTYRGLPIDTRTVVYTAGGTIDAPCQPASPPTHPFNAHEVASLPSGLKGGRSGLVLALPEASIAWHAIEASGRFRGAAHHRDGA